MKRKVLYISGTRADYGLMQALLAEISRDSRLSLEIVATGMHIMKEFGMTVNEIKNDGYNVHVVEVAYEKDDKESMSRFIGRFIEGLTDKIHEIEPDIILVLGDRGEMLAGAIVGAYLSIPVAHLHGGELTSTIDDSARHAISKLSNIHFPSSKQSANRLIGMGENPSNVFPFGSPGIDTIIKTRLLEPGEVAKKYGLNLSEPILLMIQHPVTVEEENAPHQIRMTLDAISDLGFQTVLIYPNADSGGRKMIEVIKEYENLKFLHTYSSIPHDEYLSLMKTADILVGNSSSGIIEAPSFHLPVVNIGTRQKGRERSINIIDTSYEKMDIKKAIERALSPEFRDEIKDSINPYGDGQASPRIASILAEIEITPELIQKRMYEIDKESCS